MVKDCHTCIYKEGACYPSLTIFDKDKTCKSYRPDYEGYIAELENKIADIKANCDYVLEGKEVEYREERKKLCIDFENMKAGLESQIATLGERCNQLLKDKGNLTDELDERTKDLLNANHRTGQLEQQIQDIIGMLNDILWKCTCKEYEKATQELKELINKWEIKENG